MSGDRRISEGGSGGWGSYFRPDDFGMGPKELERAPVRLSPILQVFLPIELTVVVRSLWETVDEIVDVEDPAHEIKVWTSLMRVLYDAQPEAATKSSATALTPSSRQYLLTIGYINFFGALAGRDIHSIKSGQEDINTIIEIAFAVYKELKSNETARRPLALRPPNEASVTSSALLSRVKAGEAGLFAVFGGQGVRWLPELRGVYRTYSFIKPIVDQAAAVLKQLAKSTVAFKRTKFDLKAWLNMDPSSGDLPSDDFLASAPVSYPMIGLTQLVHYLITVRWWNVSPAEALSKLFKGVTGHSQGILSAIAVALSPTEEDLVTNIYRIVQVLFIYGLRLQEAVPFPIKAPPEVLQESRDSGWGAPTPMLSVFHMQREVLERYVKLVNHRAKNTFQNRIEISLTNGPRAFVVTGKPESLHQLLSLLHKAEAPRSSTPDQSRVPFSKRKREFSFRYLPVSVPFHNSDQLQSAVSAIVRDLAFMYDSNNIRRTLDRDAVVALKGDGMDIAQQLLNPKNLLLPVYSSENGTDLRECPELLLETVLLNCTKEVDWPRATQRASPGYGVTHIVDFGPGGPSGAGSIFARNREGGGVNVVLAGAVAVENSIGLCGKEMLFDSDPQSLRFARDWGQEYAPRLIHRSGDDALVVSTKFSQLTGRPPVIMAGMTPTSVNHQLVAAATNGGFWAELAGGGLSTPQMFRSRIDELVAALDEGQFIWVNSLYLNPRQWAFQFPILAQLAQEGYPIEGLTIGAGVPSLDKAVEIITKLSDSGVKNVSFKPGSLQAILQVVEIAQNCPSFPIIIQWTGGRGGGHHSFEDFHEPVLASYAAIRSVANLTLIAGSGFGDSAGAWPYLTGHWSTEYGYPPMPFDGILLGSRCMVAKEAWTARPIKELICRTPGVAREREWEATYEKDGGGVISVRSELGEAVHVLATRGTLLWREFDKRYFSLPLAKRGDKIVAEKDVIIRKLNADFQRVYFGQNSAGEVVDLEAMTYAEVARRMVELMVALPGLGASRDQVEPEGAVRWIHPSYLQRVHLFGQRMEERFIDVVEPLALSESRIPPISLLKSNPDEWLNLTFEEIYPQARSQLLCSEDIDWLVALCRQRGLKPVNFIPVIDGNLEYWFKKDSLWQSEDIAAVPEGDAGRLFVLQGPVSVRHSTIPDEGITDILQGVHQGWISALLESAGVEEEVVPKTEYLNTHSSAPAVSPTELCGLFPSVKLERRMEGDLLRVTVRMPSNPNKLPDPALWQAFLAQGEKCWWRALVVVRQAVRGKGRLVRNVAAQLFVPRPQTTFTLWLARPPPSRAPVARPSGVAMGEEAGLSMVGRVVVRAEVRDRLQNEDEEEGEEGALVVEVGTLGRDHQKVSFSKGGDFYVGTPITVTVYHRRPVIMDTEHSEGERKGTSRSSTVLVPLRLSYSYRPDLGWAPLHIVSDNWNTNVRKFYGSLWTSDDVGTDDEGTPVTTSDSKSPTVDFPFEGGAKDPQYAVLGQLQEDLKADGKRSLINQVWTHRHTVTKESIASFVQAISRETERSSEPTGLPGSPILSSEGASSPRARSNSRLRELQRSRDGALAELRSAPMDYAIVAVWESLISPLVEGCLDGDLLQLVHLTNTFTRVDPPVLSNESASAAAPGPAIGLPILNLFVEGRTVDCEARVTQVESTPSGQRVVVRATLQRVADSGNATTRTPMVIVESAFLFRSPRPVHPPFQFSTLYYTVSMESEEQLEVLRSKPWLAAWAEDKYGGLRVGDTLFFEVGCLDAASSDSPALDDTSSVLLDVYAVGKVQVVRGDVLAVGAVTGGARGDIGAVCCVRHKAAGVRGNRVLAWLRRHGQPVHRSVFFATGGYRLLASSDVVAAPSESVSYALASGDLNPIHTNPYFAELAELPGTIVHGMWSSANAYRVVEGVAGKLRPASVLSFGCDFVGMVNPRDTLITTVRHVGMRAGHMLVEAETRNRSAGNALVVKAKASVRGPKSAFIFTGQGSAEKGMGMALYASSAVAKAVWDEADAYLLDQYGYSILDIVRDNPKTHTVHFGGQWGARMRKNYMALTQRVRTRDSETGLVRTVEKKLFPSISSSTSRYLFSHREGLLFATQFSQPALVLVELAAFLDMKSQGLVPGDCMFAGHSLGEYAALASVAGVLSVQALVQIVFLRGMTMQGAVERDAKGRSPYGMVAISPARVHPSDCGEEGLQAVIEAICAEHDELLQVVNYNAINYQYVVAGERGQLNTLGLVLNKMRALALSRGWSAAMEQLKAIITGALDATRKAKAAQPDGWIELTRGQASIPLPGIDVPFHSHFLKGGVPAFRRTLLNYMDPHRVQPLSLVGRYIPNVVAAPFSTHRSYVELVARETGSELLQELLDHWTERGENRVDVAFTLLIELLAYQFASPVRWIETQHLFFTALDIERLVEIGPAPTLTTLARRTLQNPAYSPLIACEILWYGRDRKAIYFEHEDADTDGAEEDEAEGASFGDGTSTEIGSETGASNIPEPVAPSPVPAAATTATAPPAASPPEAAMEDQTVPVLLALRVLVAHKLRRPLEDAGPDANIHALVAGKSALQNEILGDVTAEFGSDPDHAAEMDLSALADRLKDANAYKAPGKILGALIRKLANDRMPAGVSLSALRKRVAGRYGLGPGRVDALLLLGVADPPPDRLAAPSLVDAWTDACAVRYGSLIGRTLAPNTGGGGVAGGESGSGAHLVDNRALQAMRKEQEELLRRQIDAAHAFLNDDPLAHHLERQAETALRHEAEATRDALALEHGEQYIEGIKGIFDSKKARRFQSSWAAVRQDCLALYYDYCLGNLTQWTNALREKLYHIKNRSTREVTANALHYARVKAKSDGYPEIVRFISILAETLESVIDDDPAYREVAPPTRPQILVETDGRIVYTEVPRYRHMSEYVVDLGGAAAAPDDEARSDTGAADSVVSSADATSTLNEEVRARLEGLMGRLRDIEGAVEDPGAIIVEIESVVSTLQRGKAAATVPEDAPASRLEAAAPESKAAPGPALRILPGAPDQAGLSPAQVLQQQRRMTATYVDAMRSLASDRGMTLKDTTVLITGCGSRSIGEEVLKGLLRGGAKVYATSSSLHRSKDYFRSLYDGHGAKGSSLVVLPFNQASNRDVQALVRYIYEEEQEDVDFVIPFAALSEAGMDIGDIGDRNELAHRIMMTNVIRLIGAVKNAKAEREITNRPALVVLPFSPNHGIFGKDGLYAESKVGLEMLLNKWGSEGWSTYLSLVGAVIGWTRGTGLMVQNDWIAPAIEEELGARTFSRREMAFNVMAMLHPKMLLLAQEQPLLADLTGGLDKVKDLGATTMKMRQSLLQLSSVRRAVMRDMQLDEQIEAGAPSIVDTSETETKILPRSYVDVEFPELPSAARLLSDEAHKVKGLVSLPDTVVITGFGEMGPFGSARTRWEMESYGEFSLEGCIELAWLMGLIRYKSDETGGGVSGWIDTSNGKFVHDHQIKGLYEETILKHTGVRMVEPSLFAGYSPDRKRMMQQIAISEDMPPIEVSPDEAEQFKRQHGDQVYVFSREDVTYVQLRKGAVLWVSKALRFDRFVAGQVPTSWDPDVYGIPKDIIEQVDRVTLFTLVSTAEAMVSSGVTDPYEFYEYVHVSEVGNCIGSGFGGMQNITGTHRLRMMGERVQGDALQETFINTVPAWINMLLLSASGPVRTPVGACATAVESLELGVEAIKCGKARICVVGGVDDFSEESSYEFAQMGATNNNEEDAARGRLPAEMSRPATSTRNGFVEAQGAGVQILMAADLAVAMGVPIYGVVELVSTAMDKEGRSVPAPGQGILTTARESHTLSHSPLVLDADYRRRQVEYELAQVDQWAEVERSYLAEKAHADAFTAADAADLVVEVEEDSAVEHEGASSESPAHSSCSSVNADALTAEYAKALDHEAARKRRAIHRHWGNDFWLGNPHIAPLRGALAVWGLTADDIGVASFHGTSTKANDKNECEVLQKQLEHLGRSPGNGILTIWQKYLTGHPKGSAASWMLNGLLQSILSGTVPGNRNADNIDPELRKHEHMIFLNRSVQTYGLKCGVLKSFGFGQVGAEVLVIHPDYLLSQLSEEELKRYSGRRQLRMPPPYSEEAESAVYLDPLKRATFNHKAGTWTFGSAAGAAGPRHAAAAGPAAGPLGRGGLKRAEISSSALTHLEVTMREMGEGMRTPVDKGIGIDAQLIAEIEVAVSNNINFVRRNFTTAEISYCNRSADPSSSFAGRWAAKEAVIKAISSCDMDHDNARNLWKGAGAPLKDVEVLRGKSGAPTVTLHGYAKEVATALGVSQLKVAISHSGDYAVAQAFAQ